MLVFYYNKKVHKSIKKCIEQLNQDYIDNYPDEQFREESISLYNQDTDQLIATNELGQNGYKGWVMHKEQTKLF